MTLYLVNRTNGCSYDEYDGFVIAAPTQEEAIKLALDKQDGVFVAAEIGIGSYINPTVILSFFNAG